jgi:hypothetical protein
MDFEQAKVKASEFDYFHNFVLSREFMLQHIQSIHVDSENIDITLN